MVMEVFFLKQKAAYEMRISDWSSDVCSSDLCRWSSCTRRLSGVFFGSAARIAPIAGGTASIALIARWVSSVLRASKSKPSSNFESMVSRKVSSFLRSEEHTSELQSLMRISYAFFCLKKKKTHLHSTTQ